MKKVLILLAALALLTACFGCTKTPLYQQDAKEFSHSGMHIKLTEGFRQIDADGYTTAFDSDEVAVFVLKEAFSLQAGLEDYTVTQYADMVHTANASKLPGPVQKTDGLTVMEYSFYNAEKSCTFKYLSTMFKGSDAFWLIQFACDSTKYDDYKAHFISWAKTVTFD